MAGNLQYVDDGLGVAWGYEKITPGDVSTGISASLITHSSGLTSVAALITCEDQAVHFTQDGTAPTAKAGTDVGHLLSPGDSIVIRGNRNVESFRCIDKVSGSAGSLKITVFR